MLMSITKKGKKLTSRTKSLMQKVKFYSCNDFLKCHVNVNCWILIKVIIETFLKIKKIYNKKYIIYIAIRR